MPVRRLKDDAVLDHPVRRFLSSLVGVVTGAEEALAAFDDMSRRSMDLEHLLLRYQALGADTERALQPRAR
jgi:hypothetical protein